MKRAAWAPRLTRPLIRIRIAIVVSMTCGFYLLMSPMPLSPLAHVLLPPLLALSIAGLLMLTELESEDGTGRTDEGRRRR
jgi:hypothetical protein